MTTFEEQFPLLCTTLNKEQETAEGGWIETRTSTIKQCCLDKQRVREILDKAYEEGVRDYSELAKRLGL